MSLFILISVLILAILIIVIARFAASKKVWKIMTAIVGIIVVTLILFGCAYMFNRPLREGVDMIFDNKTQHDCRIGNTVVYYVPLPPKTIFAFRTSETGARYVTRTTKDDMLSFFSNLDELSSPENSWQEDDFTVLSFWYEQKSFIVKIEQSEHDGKWGFFIDLNE